MGEVQMTFDEALSAASKGNLAKAMQFFAADEQPLSSLMIRYKDYVAFHDDGGMPTTSLRREFTLCYRGSTLVSWCEEYEGYYGAGYTGWWIEEIDCDGPPNGLQALLKEAGIAMPNLEVPRPPISDDEDLEPN